MSMESFDLIVIGGGPGGHAVAEEAALQGARVCIIERNGWGGTCTHRGCVPTKALLVCSRHYVDLKKIKRFGISLGEAGFDYAVIRRHRAQMTRISALGVEKTLQAAGVTMRNGYGRILSSGKVQWTSATGESETLAASHLVIAWGSEPSLPPFLLPKQDIDGRESPASRRGTSSRSEALISESGALSSVAAASANDGRRSPDDVPGRIPGRVLTSDAFLQLAALPQSVVIIGGSVIGVEFATFLAEVGTKVEIVEILPSILPYEEEEAAEFLARELQKMGIKIHTALSVGSLEEKGGGVIVGGDRDGNRLELEAEYALVCTGRRPRIDEESLREMDIRYDRRGIAVNEHQETNIAGIYAIGDVTGGIMLAHRAQQQGRALASRLFGDGTVVYREEMVPSVTYTHPPIARIGLTERQARENGWNVEIRRTDYGVNIMARTELAGPGFAKFIFHAGRLVGATIAGEGAPDLIAALTLAMTVGADLKTLRGWILPHPTLSEVLRL